MSGECESCAFDGHGCGTAFDPAEPMRDEDGHSDGCMMWTPKAKGKAVAK